MRETPAGRAGGRATGEAGAGTVLVLAVVGALALAGAGCSVLAHAVVAGHRAAVAADLAALAAADVLVGRAAGNACARAAATAGANGARLLACRPGSSSVEVEVAVALTGAAAVLGDARRQARAGPGQVHP